MNTHPPRRHGPARHDRRTPAAFTLTELIVVIIIIILLTAVSVPSIRSTLASTDSSNAETQLRLALLSGRDAALHSDRGVDTAVVFTYEPGGRTTALVCELVGSFDDESNGPANAVNRDIFVPIPTFPPLQLPPGWMVGGFVPAGTLDLGSSVSDWYEGGRYDAASRNWLFPETDFYDQRDTDDGQDRQSFMVRFTAGTGAVDLGSTREALVVSPRATAQGRSNPPPSFVGTNEDWQNSQVDRKPDVAAVVRKALLRDDWRGTGNVTTLFGNISGDTILCRTIDQLVLYKIGDLSAALGKNADRDSGCFYRDSEDPTFAVPPAVMDSAYAWLEGNTNLDNDWLDDGDLPVARIYTVQRYTGALQPVPLRDLSQSNRPGGSQ